jgi:hypothetical protein
VSLVPLLGPGQDLMAQKEPNPLLKNEARRPSASWVPPDIDALVPAVDSQRPCSLPDVLEGAERGIQELLHNLDRFTATEVVDHQNVSSSGKLGKVQERKFNYLVDIAPGANGHVIFNELREPSADDQFPDRTATTGTPSLMLVFHPVYAEDFQMQCDGLGSWQGKPAWQIRFEQRADRGNHMSRVVIGGRSYSIQLRGRAWILADSYHLVHLETDLVNTIPQIRLRIEHMSVDYGPVAFTARKAELWLPLSAELYMDFNGHRFYRRHSFEDFILFSVEVNQRFTAQTYEH